MAILGHLLLSPTPILSKPHFRLKFPYYSCVMADSRFTALKDALTPEIVLKSSIKNTVGDSSKALSQSSVDIRDKLYDHDDVEKFKESQKGFVTLRSSTRISIDNANVFRLEEETKSLRVRMKEVTSLEKERRGVALRTLKADAGSHKLDAVMHRDVVKVSYLMASADISVLTVAGISTTAQNPSRERRSAKSLCTLTACLCVLLSPEKNLNKTTSSSSASNAATPSWHPVRNWDPALIDAINAMGPWSATRVEK